jgi:hypothetical protein
MTLLAVYPAPPMKTDGNGEEQLVEDAVPVDVIVKLAQVRRVALLLWMTIDLSPKKYGEPGVVERYRSE